MHKKVIIFILFLGLVVLLAMELNNSQISGDSSRIDAVSTPSSIITLENQFIALAIDRQTGSVISIHDKKLDVAYKMKGISFSLTTDRGTLHSAVATGVKKNDETATFSFDTKDFDISLYYHLGSNDKFIEKWLEIKAKDTRPYFIQEIVLEDVKLSTQFKEIHYHDDQTIWACPINLFLRCDKGGCFAGLEYPYWQMDIQGNEGFRLGFTPNYSVEQGQVFVSEKYFLGICRNEGIYRYSHGPYPGHWAKKPNLLSFEDVGLKQHFKDGVINTSAIKPEVLDWGEVWAMQEFMRNVLPDDLPLPEEGFWIWQNGWWAGLFEPQNEQIDRLKDSGIHDVMTANTWYGRGTHPNTEPYLTNMRVSPMGFPVGRDTGAKSEEQKTGEGFHTEAKAGREFDDVKEYTPDFRAPEKFEDFIAYGRKIGVHVSSFSLPVIYFSERPEWASIDEQGKVSEYLFGRKNSCPACDEYMDHQLNLLDHVFNKYKPRWWGFDGRWLSYWEVPKYRTGSKGLGFDTCYSKNHGHLPGDNLYKEWKNIQNLLRELRRRHPQMCLEQYYGLKRGGPWALRHFNADDNYFETSGATMNRFQTWHNQNDRFRPPYKNYAAIFGESIEDFRYSLISSISVTAYCQLGPGYKGLVHKENQDFLKKWRGWATKNHAYLKVKRDMFDCPGFGRVDGSAHIIKDRGYIFLFSVEDKSSEATVRVSVNINRWLGLEESPAKFFTLTEIYPQENRVLGIYRYGEQFLYDMPPGNAAVILSLEATPPGEKVIRTTLRATGENVQVVKAFSETAGK